MMVEGQVHGGIVHSLGQAFMEEAVFDKDGHFANPSYMDYAMPRADDVPNFKWDFYKGAPCQTNPLGAKGVGELGTHAGPFGEGGNVGDIGPQIFQHGS